MNPIEKSVPPTVYNSLKKNEVNHETTVGLTNKEDLSYKGDFKNGQPHGEWTTYFPDGKPRWEGYKKKASIMALLLCGMKMEKKDRRDVRKW